MNLGTFGIRKKNVRWKSRKQEGLKEWIQGECWKRSGVEEGRGER